MRSDEPGLVLPECIPFVCRLRGRHSAFRRTTGPAPQAPPVYPRVLSEAPAVAHRCGAGLPRSDSEEPFAGSTPLRGRRAELDESQTTRSEPRRKRSFTGHRSSSLAERPRKAPVYFGGLGEHPQRLFGYFLCGQKVTAGRGGAKPPLVSRHSAFRRTTDRAEQARG